jgi:hypothetical protein
MTPFQAIRATIYMLLAKARGPIPERELIRAPSRARHQRSRAERANGDHPLGPQPMRRKSDHPSSFQRIWQTIIASVGHGDAGTQV